MTLKSLGEQNYEQFAQRYAAYAETKAHNAYYDRPNTLSLLPDLHGKRVLDAGCGPGIYAEILLERGADVVAFDVTPDFVALTQKRVGGRATVLRADLTQPLTFAADASFDVVLCPLVLDYIEDIASVFTEFLRVLKPGGTFIYSVGHPIGDWLWVQRNIEDYKGSYFDTELFDAEWGGFGDPKPRIRSYRRPLEAHINPLIRVGFTLDYFLEAKPVPEMAQVAPDDYAKLSQMPGFIVLRALKATA